MPRARAPGGFSYLSSSQAAGSAAASAYQRSTSGWARTAAHVGPRVGRQLRLPGEEARDHRGVHRIRQAEVRAEQEGPAAGRRAPRARSPRCGRCRPGSRACGRRRRSRGRGSSAWPGAGRGSRHASRPRWRGHGRAARGRPARGRGPSSAQYSAMARLSQIRRAAMFQVGHQPGRGGGLRWRRGAAPSSGITTSSTSSPARLHRQPAAQAPGGVALAADDQAAFRRTGRPELPCGRGSAGGAACPAACPRRARRWPGTARLPAAGAARCCFSGIGPGAAAMNEMRSCRVRTTSTPSGCPTPTTSTSRPRRACSPVPRACPTSPPTGRRSWTAPPGLWCCNAGHGRREITEAIQKQAAMMDFAPTFQLGHPIAFEAAARVAEMTPDGMDRVFFTNSGSESRRHRAEDRAGLPQARGEAQPRAPDRAGARLPRRRLRRHVGGRHRRRTASSSAPSFPMWTTCRTPTCRRRTPSPRASRSTARTWPTCWRTWSRCTARHHRRRDGRAGRGFDRRAGAARGLPAAPAGALHEARHPADLRRGHHRLRPPRHQFRRRAAGRDARHHDHGEGPDQRRGADGRGRHVGTAIYDAIVDGAPAGIELFHGYTYSGHPLAARRRDRHARAAPRRGPARPAPRRWSPTGRRRRTPARPSPT